MSLRSFETLILAAAKITLNNPKLRLKDIAEWSTGEVKPHEGEIVIALTEPRVNIAVLKTHDRRPNDGGQR
jgi:hypothetical protein